MIFATSCENELELGAAGEESMVSFTIATPDMGSRAYSDGTTATKLQYAVYDAAGNELEDLGLLVKIVHKIGVVFVYWSKIVHKCGYLPAFSTCI